MSEPFNLYDAPVEGDPARPAGYGRRMLEFGEAIGAAQLGGSVYELDPGDSISPYHYERSRRSGCSSSPGGHAARPGRRARARPRRPRLLRPGARGSAQGHEPLPGRRARPDVLDAPPGISICVYPDSDKVGVWPPGGRYRMSETLGYWDGEL